MAHDDDDDRDRRPRDDDEPPRRRRPRDDDEFDDDDRPLRRGGSGAAGAAAAGGAAVGGVMVIVIIGAVLFVMVLCGVIGVGLLLPAVQKTRDAANRMSNTNNLKQIGLAMHNYHDTTQTLPNNSYNAKGEPLLSWRVHILPYIEEAPLYQQFKLDEPWDSPNNKPLLNRMPRAYLHVGRQEPGATVTHYRGFSHQGAIFAKPNLDVLRTLNNRPRGVIMRQIADLPENTLFVVEANDPVEWTKPDDIDFSPGRPLPTLGNGKNTTFLALFGDGAVRQVRTSLDERTLRNGTTIADGNVVNFD